MRLKPLLRNPWFLVFETALGEIMDRLHQVGITDRITFMFNRMDSFAPTAMEIYNQIRSLPKEDISYVDRLGMMSFATEADVARVKSLQAADMFVYEANRYARDTVIKKERRPMRWQWEKLASQRPWKSVNGCIWRREVLEELATEVEKDRSLREILAIKDKVDKTHQPQGEPS